MRPTGTGRGAVTKHAQYDQCPTGTACGIAAQADRDDVIVPDLAEVDCLACWHWIMDYSVLRIDGIEKARGQVVEKPPTPERAYVRAVPLNVSETDEYGTNATVETWIDKGRQGRLGPLALGLWVLVIDEGNVRVRQTGNPTAELDESDMLLAPQHVPVHVDGADRYIHLLCP